MIMVSMARMANVDRKQPTFIQIPEYSASFLDIAAKIQHQIRESK